LSGDGFPLSLPEATMIAIAPMFAHSRALRRDAVWVADITIVTPTKAGYVAAVWTLERGVRGLGVAKVWLELPLRRDMALAQRSKRIGASASHGCCRSGFSGGSVAG